MPQVHRLLGSFRGAKGLGVLLTVAIGISGIAYGAMSIDAVNQKVAGELTRFNNNLVKASLKFSKLNVDNEAARDFAMSLDYSRVGTQNIVRVRVPELSYSNPKGLSQPKAAAKVLLAFDVLKALERSEIDQLVPNLDQMFISMAADTLSQYGDAATLDVKIDKVNRDKDNHVVALEFHMNLNIDLTKLPSSRQIESEILKSIQLNASLGVKGAAASIEVAFNDKYKAFAKDESGMKELVEGLLNGDAKVLSQFTDILQGIDSMAAQVVEYSVKH